MRTIAYRSARRLIAALPVLLGVLVFTFVLMRMLPGDPAVFFASGPSSGEAEIEAMRVKLGLDRSVPEQLLLYLGDVVTGDFGTSMTTGRPVLDDLSERLPASLELTILALILALGTALPLGILAALMPGSMVDHAVRIVCTAGVAMPTFVSGLLLIFVFYYLLGWSPDPTGRIDVFLIAPPEVTGFLLVDSLIAGDGEVFMAALGQLLLCHAHAGHLAHLGQGQRACGGDDDAAGEHAGFDQEDAARAVHAVTAPSLAGPSGASRRTSSSTARSRSEARMARSTRSSSRGCWSMMHSVPMLSPLGSLSGAPA